MKRAPFRRAGVIGGGAWGTALAQVCARAGREVTLWAREAEVVEAINTRHVNEMFLPGVPLDGTIRATGDFVDLARSDLVLAVAPAQHLRATLTAFAPHAEAGLPILLCSKGVEQGSLKLMSDVLAETIPAAAPAVLSGPSFAGEVARGLPTAVTLACADEGCAQDLGERGAPGSAADDAGPLQGVAHALAPLRPALCVGLAAAAASSSGQRGRATASSGSERPSARRSAPARAIIAALSVQ